jgi:hypothetical protein
MCHGKSIFILTQTDTYILFTEVKLQIVVVLETCYVFFPQNELDRDLFDTYTIVFLYKIIPLIDLFPTCIFNFM